MVDESKRKKLNTVFFVLLATLFNLVVFFVVFVACMALYLLVIAPYLLSGSGLETLAAPFLAVIFILSIVLSFLIYRSAINYFFRKVDPEERFSPLFVKTPKGM
ncbi:MAG: leader peptide processing enzyme [Spirochaetaceae bacterium]|jgi:ABC-type transport system involved in cytochrome bd biosynthesis fused ATPase/permease subunit|nr:leader peptide processing enzyme [Spirochaetaceae bacterium]